MSTEATSATAGPSLRYALSDEAARARGRATGAWSAVSTLMPPVLVMVMIAEMGLAPLRVVLPIAALVAALGVARGVTGYRTATRRLRALEVTVSTSPAALDVRTARVALRITPADVERIVEIGGPLGGLRLELRDVEELPDRIDIPRGGAGFGDLRAELGAWRPVERGPRRRRFTRFALGAGIVLGIFFLPFFVDDVAMRSRAAACAVVLGLWMATRAVLARA